MKSQMTWYVKWHEISNDIKAQRQWLFKIGPEPNATSSPFVNISVPKHSPSAPDILKTPVRMLNRDPVWVKGKWLLLFSYLYEPSVSCCYNQIYIMTWNLKWCEISNDIESQMTWNLKRHEISNDMKSQMTWNVKSHKNSKFMKCKMSWNVKCHKM